MIYRSPYPDVDIPNITLQDYLFEHAAKYADKTALIDGPSGRTLTYGQLVGAIRRTAAGLAARGFGKGDVFAIYSPTCRSTPSRSSVWPPPAASTRRSTRCIPRAS